MFTFKRNFCLFTIALLSYTIQAQTPCSGGSAAGYPCNGIDLMSFTSLSVMGASATNDIWGWTSPNTGNEYVLLGLDNGTAFFNITNAANPTYLGKLPTYTVNSSWRDIKVFNNHAFIVSEASGHGMQIFNLLQLDGQTSAQTWSNTAYFDGSRVGVTFGSAHNIVINEESGYAYIVGAGQCSGGLYAIDINNPVNPDFVGCFSNDGYTHDAQCINYIGPDPQHQGKEICLNSNENTLTIVDVSDKSDMTPLSITGYSGSSYTHQGWITEDHEYYLMNDELDESGFGHNTRTYIWDVRDLDNPVFLGYYEANVGAIDHNLYIKGNLAYCSNYRSGLRVLDITNIASGNLTEHAYFDTYPSSNSASFSGTWSNYPYFASGVIAVSGIDEGLFLLKLTAPTCDDGIQNGDEEDVDCGGSCPACPPDPTCDDGIQNGDEEGIDCGGSSCVACPCNDIEITVTINFDNYPEETSWSITDANSATVASGGLYVGQPDGSTVTEEVCLTEGCYVFTINDAFGDGICCNYGNGSYSVADANGNILASGAEFVSSESTQFCVSSLPTWQTCDPIIDLGTTTLSTGTIHAQNELISTGIVPAQTNVSLKAGQTIELGKGFNADANANTEIIIEDCVPD